MDTRNLKNTISVPDEEKEDETTLYSTQEEPMGAHDNTTDIPVTVHIPPYIYDRIEEAAYAKHAMEENQSKDDDIVQRYIRDCMGRHIVLFDIVKSHIRKNIDTIDFSRYGNKISKEERDSLLYAIAAHAYHHDEYLEPHAEELFKKACALVEYGDIIVGE